jgi:hypothetical protein
MADFYHVIEQARQQSAAYLGTELRRDQQATAMCHLAETLLMHAQGRAGTEYVRAWLRKIDAHLDCDHERAARAIIGVREPRLH